MKYFGHDVINVFRSHTPRGFYDSVKGHTGIDIATPSGTPITMNNYQEVIDIKRQNQMGLTMYTKDKDGNICVFAHLSETLRQVGDAVQPGDVFAKTGNSGSATTGPHLHFEIISQTAEDPVMTRQLGPYYGYNIDPVAYLERISEPHWSYESFRWAKEHQIVNKGHDPDSFVTWGEFVVVMHRLSQRIMSWTNPPKDEQ